MAGNDQAPYTLPPELSSILATLAQYAPQIQSATSTSQPQSDSYTPSGPAPSQPLYRSYFPNAVTTTTLPPEQQPAQETFKPPQDPRLLNRSSTRTPDLATIGHPPPLPDLLHSQHLNQQLHSQNQQLNQYITPQIPHQQQLHPPRPQSRSQDPRPVPQSRSSTPQLANANAAGIGGAGWGGLVIDPAAITEWTAGLRCVNKIAAQNREFIGAIRKVCFTLTHSLLSFFCHHLHFSAVYLLYLFFAALILERELQGTSRHLHVELITTSTI